MRSRQAGVTLVELVVVMVIVGIIAAIAMPSFQSAAANSRLRSATADLVSAINTARAQAVSLRMNVELSARGSDWGNGWDITYHYPSTVPSSAQTEQNQSFPRSGDVVVTETGGATSVVFLPSGFVSGGTKQFSVCYNGRLRTIGVSQLGKVSNTQGTC